MSSAMKKTFGWRGLLMVGGIEKGSSFCSCYGNGARQQSTRAHATLRCIVIYNAISQCFLTPIPAPLPFKWHWRLWQSSFNLSLAINFIIILSKSWRPSFQEHQEEAFNGHEKSLSPPSLERCVKNPFFFRRRLDIRKVYFQSTAHQFVNRYKFFFFSIGSNFWKKKVMHTRGIWRKLHYMNRC